LVKFFYEILGQREERKLKNETSRKKDKEKYHFSTFNTNL
jgi:hypothetical protein